MLDHIFIMLLQFFLLDNSQKRPRAPRASNDQSFVLWHGIGYSLALDKEVFTLQKIRGLEEPLGFGPRAKSSSRKIYNEIRRDEDSPKALHDYFL